MYIDWLSFPSVSSEMSLFTFHHTPPLPLLWWQVPSQTSYIRRALVGNPIVDHSDLVRVSTVGAAPTASSFFTQHLASIYCTKTTAKRDEKHFSLGIWWENLRYSNYHWFDMISCRHSSLQMKFWSASLEKIYVGAHDGKPNQSSCCNSTVVIFKPCTIRYFPWIFPCSAFFTDKFCMEMSSNAGNDINNTVNYLAASCQFKSPISSSLGRTGRKTPAGLKTHDCKRALHQKEAQRICLRTGVTSLLHFRSHWYM